tara:strand:+ start:1278 stop:1865 length:588 start_codon:yes stop_codon:yes gene_type:complete
MADTILTNAFISLNDIINNFIISYTGPGKLIPDSNRTEVVFHARRCLQEFAYETLKSQFLADIPTVPNTYTLPADFVSVISVNVGLTTPITYTQVKDTPATQQFSIDYSTKIMSFNVGDVGDADLKLKYLSNALTTDESAAIPKLAEEALYACMVYAILANRENTNPNTLQRLLIEKIDKLERSKSRLIFTNFSS